MLVEELIGRKLFEVTDDDIQDALSDIIIRLKHDNQTSFGMESIIGEINKILDGEIFLDPERDRQKIADMLKQYKNVEVRPSGAVVITPVDDVELDIEPGDEAQVRADAQDRKAQKAAIKNVQRRAHGDKT